jgi:hypothetical protein
MTSKSSRSANSSHLAPVPAALADRALRADCAGRADRTALGEHAGRYNLQQKRPEGLRREFRS